MCPYIRIANIFTVLSVVINYSGSYSSRYRIAIGTTSMIANIPIATAVVISTTIVTIISIARTTFIMTNMIVIL